jgi:hypothetical protein
MRGVIAKPGPPNFLCQTATPIIVGSFAGRTLKNDSSVVPNHLNYCLVFTIRTQFTNVAASRIIRPVGPRVGNSHCKGRNAILQVLKINELRISRYGKGIGRLNLSNTNRGTIVASRPIVNKKMLVF